jgi:hypothetical protein
MKYNLSKLVKVSTAITPTAGAAAQTTINGTTLDMAGYGGVMVLLRLGTITSGAVTSIKAQQGAASNLSDAADLEGTSQTIADSDGDETFLIDCKPSERYFRVVVTRGTQDAVVASANYLQYEPHHPAVTQGTGVTAETHVTGVEGTA